MNEPWEARLLRGRALESVLALTAVVAVTWPLGDLVADRPWTAPLLGLLLLILAVGSLVRMARAPRWLVLLAQLLALVSGLSWWAQAERPGESALAAGNALVVQGVETIQTFAVPAPATAGLTFLVLAGTGLLALLVDALGVTYRAAAVAGVPLLLVSAASASSSGQPLEPQYFLLAAAAWLILLARQGRSVIQDWSAHSSATTTVDNEAAARGSRRRLVTARVTGVAALTLAVAVPMVLPHLPPTVLLDRSGEGAPGSVTFTETLDLAQDLADRSNAPVIRYRTDDSSPPPLRVTSTTEYSDGQWLPTDEADGTDTMLSDGLYTATGHELQTSDEIDGTSETLTVTQNGLGAPQLAVPYPPTTLELGDISWRWSLRSDVVLVDSAPSSYEVSYLEVAPLTSLPDGIGAPPERLLDVHPVTATETAEDGTIFRMGEGGSVLEIIEPDGTRNRFLTDGTTHIREPDGTVRRTVANVPGSDPLAVDPVSEDRVRGLADDLIGDLTNQIDIAMALQNYLRGPEFSYSLTLADPVEGPEGQRLDPISHFMETKQGYCTQFATLMVMLARAADIPARMAIGFLPGSQGLDGTRTVVAADAHAWPELYINGLGWTRFEPTPGTRSGTAPFYGSTGEQQEVPTPAPDPTVAEPTVDPTVPDAGVGRGGTVDAGWFERNGPTVGWSALGLAAAAVALSVVPAAAWWRRWRLRRGRDAAARIEGEWAVLTTTMADLGVAAPPAATPRGLQQHYLRELAPDAPTRDALARATGRLEAARYAATTPPLATMREDTHRVVEWGRHHAPRRRRLRAALLPASGLAQLRSLLPGTRAVRPGPSY